jgi:hypothetical protein
MLRSISDHFIENVHKQSSGKRGQTLLFKRSSSTIRHFFQENMPVLSYPEPVPKDPFIQRCMSPGRLNFVSWGLMPVDDHIGA